MMMIHSTSMATFICLKHLKSPAPPIVHGTGLGLQFGFWLALGLGLGLVIGLIRM